MKYTCVTCSGSFERWPKKSADFVPKYCSLECEHQGRSIVKRDQLVGLFNEGLSITAAAVRLGVSQPSVSRAVKRYAIKRKVVAS